MITGNNSLEILKIASAALNDGRNITAIVATPDRCAVAFDGVSISIEGAGMFVVEHCDGSAEPTRHQTGERAYQAASRAACTRKNYSNWTPAELNILRDECAKFFCGNKLTAAQWDDLYMAWQNFDTALVGVLNTDDSVRWNEKTSEQRAQLQVWVTVARALSSVVE